MTKISIWVPPVVELGVFVRVVDVVDGVVRFVSSWAEASVSGWPYQIVPPPFDPGFNTVGAPEAVDAFNVLGVNVVRASACGKTERVIRPRPNTSVLPETLAVTTPSGLIVTFVAPAGITMFGSSKKPW